MKKIFLFLSTGLITLILYECRPGYVVILNKVYYNHISEGVGYERINMNADAKSFTVEKEFPAYGMDKNKAYYFGKPIFGSDGATFKILSGGYQKDKNNVYYQNRIIPYADSKTFKEAPTDSSGHEYIRFAEDVYDFYYCGTPLRTTNKKEFRQWYINGYLWGIDTRYCYCQNKKSEIGDYNSFKVLSSGTYAKDKEYVFFLGKIVDGADPKSFEETTIFCGKDKNRTYKMGKPTI